MSELVSYCPRCGAKEMTFDLLGAILVGIEYSWQHWFEAFCVCRNCKRSTTFVLAQDDISYKDEIKKGLANLTALFLEKTKVTDEGVKKLQEALPKCHISL